MRCAIVGAGDFYPEEFNKDLYGLIIAADGGYESLRKIGVTPDLLIGDLDSISTVPRGVDIIRHKVEKDETDMHLAYLEGVRRGYSEFDLFGGVGGRDDHTFANYSLLMRAKKENNLATLYGKDCISFVISRGISELFGECGKRFSVFAFGGSACGVSIKGAKYEADGITLTPDFALGVSNSFLEPCVKISVESGFLLVMREI